MKKRWWATIALFSTIGLIALAAYYFTRPTLLRVAVSNNNVETARLLTHFAFKLRADNANIRLRVSTRANYDEVIKAMENGEADLGVFRNEIAFPQNMSLVAVMQKNPIALLVRSDGTIKSFTDLKDKKIGVVSRRDLSPQIFERLLREYEVPLESVKIFKAAAPDAIELAKKEDLDGLFIVGPSDAAFVREAESNFTKLHYGNVRVVPIKENDAISRRAPFLESIELSAGAFGGNPPRPAETVKTLATALVLIANNSLSNQVVGDFAQEFMASKATISLEHPSALRIQAPDVELNAAFPVHPGAYAFYNDTRQSLLERYGDYFYIGIMSLSLIGTLLAGALGVKKARKKREDAESEEPLEELALLLRKVKLAESVDELNALTESADLLLIHCLEEKENHSNPSYVNLIVSTLERLRRSIDEKRRSLNPS